MNSDKAQRKEPEWTT